ncbi:MAG: SPOCS domain-containing protein [Huintestinicola sp.]
MSLKVNKEAVRACEKICSCTQEQSIELDYVLPDYYPEIFRIVRCCAEPQLTACVVNGDRVNYELTVCLRVIYCSEGNGTPEVVEQKLVYSRTVNLDRPADGASVYITAAPDHINCRAVNRRRIDVRGAVTVNISVMGETVTETLSEAFGENIQLRKKRITCPSQVIRTQKRVVVSDDFTLAETAPPIGTILRANAEIISADKKMIAGKAAAKGELKISVVYTSHDEDSESPVTSVQFSLPFSQLVELEGLDDDFLCFINSSVVSCTVTPRSEGDGNSRQLECEVLLLIDCYAVKMVEFELACDEYSTSYASSHTAVQVRCEKAPAPLDSSLSVRGICENKDSPISLIYDARCSSSGLRLTVIEGKLMVVGNATISVMGQTENGDFIICETDIPVEEEIAADMSDISTEADIRVTFPITSCTYNITSDNTAEVKADIAVRGWLTDHILTDAITDISVDETSPREQSGDYALRLYFAENGEELWSIAKRYGASMLKIIEENELDGDVVKEAKMLLIPVA